MEGYNATIYKKQELKAKNKININYRDMFYFGPFRVKSITIQKSWPKILFFS